MSHYVATGIVAAFITIVAELIYIRSIFVPDQITGEKTVPSRVTFWIWSLVQGMTAVSYWQSGGQAAAGLSASLCVMFAIIAVLSIRYGYAQWTAKDSWLLTIAGVAGLVWWQTHDPFYAVTACSAGDVIGMFPSWWKTIKEPKKESAVAWLLALVAVFVNLGAVELFTPADYVYHASALMIVIMMNTAIFWPRQPITTQ